MSVGRKRRRTTNPAATTVLLRVLWKEPIKKSLQILLISCLTMHPLLSVAALPQERAEQTGKQHRIIDEDGNLVDLLYPWINASIPLPVLDRQPILCVSGLPPCFPPPFKHWLSPIPLDEVVECHTPQVATFYWASKDEGVTCTGISHHCFVLPAPGAHTSECLFPIKVVSSFYSIQFVRHFHKEWVLDMQICSELVSHTITPIVIVS